MFTNFHSSPSTNSTFVHEINPFHQMGNFFLPQPLYQDPHTSTPPPNNEVTPSYFPSNYSSVLYQPIYNQEVEALSSPKKDRHTKILTAQGVRDRRVRLSMGIAREFFDLQDMLGFDKASKTLGWLLARSKEAIQELALEKKSLDFDGSFSFGSHEDAIGNSSSGAMIRRRRNCSVFARENPCGKSGSGGISRVNCNKSLVVRENRAKARARARERTREKLSTTMAKPVQFDHPHGFQANGSGNYSSNLQLVDSKAQGLSQSKLEDGGTKVIKSSHPIAPGGDQGWNIFNFPSW